MCAKRTQKHTKATKWTLTYEKHLNTHKYIPKEQLKIPKKNTKIEGKSILNVTKIKKPTN